VLAYDIRESEEVRAWGVRYVAKEELLRSCDIVSLHCPLLPSTYHIIDAARWPALPCSCMQCLGLSVALSLHAALQSHPGCHLRKMLC
jgi:hypothetical protein